jgi:hypothetical protein
MVTTTGPHRDSADCIQALEDEIRRLQELLATVKRPADAIDADPRVGDRRRQGNDNR